MLLTYEYSTPLSKSGGRKAIRTLRHGKARPPTLSTRGGAPARRLDAIRLCRGLLFCCLPCPEEADGEPEPPVA